MATTVPVMQVLAGEARKPIKGATSSGMANRPIGISRRKMARKGAETVRGQVSWMCTLLISV